MKEKREKVIGNLRYAIFRIEIKYQFNLTRFNERRVFIPQ